VLLYGVSLLMGVERRRPTGMVVKHTPILKYGGDESLQSIKKIYIYIYICKKFVGGYILYVHTKLSSNCIIYIH